MDRPAVRSEKLTDRIEARPHGLRGNMFKDGDGKDRIEQLSTKRRQAWTEIFTHDFYVRELLPVAFVIGRSITEPIIGIDQSGVVTEFGQEPAYDRFAAADLEQSRRQRNIRKNCFRRPRPLDVFQVSIHAGDLRKLVEAFTVIAHGSVGGARVSAAPGKERDDPLALTWIAKDAGRHRSAVCVDRNFVRKTPPTRLRSFSSRNVRGQTSTLRPRAVPSVGCSLATSGLSRRGRVHRLDRVPTPRRHAEQSGPHWSGAK